MADKFRIRAPYPFPAKNKQPVVRISMENYLWLETMSVKFGGLPRGNLCDQCIDFCREHWDGEVPQYANI